MGTRRFILINGVEIDMTEPVNGAWTDGEEALNERYADWRDFGHEDTTEAGPLADPWELWQDGNLGHEGGGGGA